MIDAYSLKEKIFLQNRIEDILVNIGMHTIKEHDKYFSCAYPDGDNPNGCIVYKSEYLNILANTRTIPTKANSPDIIDLICFVNKLYFTQAIKLCCEILDIDYYSNKEVIPDSLKLTKLLLRMSKSTDIYNEENLEPISEQILSYYEPYVNGMFKSDGISYHTQQLFEIGIDLISGDITIPIRDELNTLVGIKARKLELTDNETKYYYLEPCAKSHILYGLNLTYDYIKKYNECIVVESEKAVMQLWSAGYYNAVATGGTNISTIQVEKLFRLSVPLLFAYDKDVNMEQYNDILSKFPVGTEIKYIYDKENLLDNKESPTDNIDKWEKLYDNNQYIYIK